MLNVYIKPSAAQVTHKARAYLLCRVATLVGTLEHVLKSQPHGAQFRVMDGLPQHVGQNGTKSGKMVITGSGPQHDIRP